MSFTKLFESILDSTVWQEDLHVKIVWITMLAMKDIDGVVHASIPGLAKRAGVTIPQCEDALDRFLAPDKYSRTKDHEGRRIEAVDGGWVVLNHDKYRDLLDAEDQRVKAAARQQRKRDKEKAKSEAVDRHASSRPVTPRHAESVTVRHADADADPSEEDLSPPARAREEQGEGQDAAPEAADQIPFALTERQKLTRHGWDCGRLRHDLLRSAGVDRTAVAWTAIPTGPGGDELPKRVREMQELGWDADKIREVLDRVIDVADATARRETHLRWFTPARVWERDSFWKSAETSPQQAAATRATARAGTRGTQPEPDRGGVNPMKFLKARS